MADIIDKITECEFPDKVFHYRLLTKADTWELIRNAFIEPAHGTICPENKDRHFLFHKDIPVVNSPRSTTRLIKARGDLLFSCFALLGLFPLFLIIGVVIKLNSKGPVFFLQERIGYRGNKFRIYKFRTMIRNADQQKHLLALMNEANGPVFKIRNDPRITWFGRFLRRSGLDELPQLYNVIKGDMSLIGPRPPLEEEVHQYESWQMRRLSVKPGITCTWQIMPNRHSIPFDLWMEMDLHYIDHWSIWMDIRLFFRTIKTFFLAKGH